MVFHDNVIVEKLSCESDSLFTIKDSPLAVWDRLNDMLVFLVLNCAFATLDIADKSRVTAEIEVHSLFISVFYCVCDGDF